jgi:hypothetical protein
MKQHTYIYHLLLLLFLNLQSPLFITVWNTYQYTLIYNDSNMQISSADNKYVTTFTGQSYIV